MHRIEAYVRLSIILIIIICLLYLPILLLLKKKGKSIIRQISYIGLFCSIFLIVFATILYMPITFSPKKNILNLNLFGWIENVNSFQQFLIEKIPNIILFIPLGIFIPLVFKSKRKFYKTILIAFLITFDVEFFQYFIGRSSDIVDILTNMIGAIIGYFLFRIMNKLFYSMGWWQKLINNKQ